MAECRPIECEKLVHEVLVSSPDNAKKHVFHVGENCKDHVVLVIVDLFVPCEHPLHRSFDTMSRYRSERTNKILVKLYQMMLNRSAPQKRYEEHGTSVARWHCQTSWGTHLSSWTSRTFSSHHRWYRSRCLRVIVSRRPSMYSEKPLVIPRSTTNAT